VRCLAIDGQGRLLAGDSATRQVYRFGADQQPVPLAQPISDNLGPLGIPMGLAANSSGEIFVSDLEFHCIWKIPQDGGTAEKFVEVPAPVGLTFDAQDNLWVVSRVENPLQKISPDGKIDIVVQDRPFNFPHNVVVDDSGTAFVVDGFARCVWKVAPGGTPEKWFEHEKLANPVDIKRHQDTLLVIDPRANALFRIQASGAASVHAF
jgi:DNA-binding beta-propeller fold protein YncE